MARNLISPLYNSAMIHRSQSPRKGNLPRSWSWNPRHNGSGKVRIIRLNARKGA